MVLLKRLLLASVGLGVHAESDPRKMLVDTAYNDLLERIARKVDVTVLAVGVFGQLRLYRNGGSGSVAV